MEQQRTAFGTKPPASTRNDRVRAHTADSVLRAIDEDTMQRLEVYADADRQVVSNRLDELDREWDTDRAVELDAAVTGLLGLALGAIVRPAFLTIPAFVGGVVLVHAMTGLHPLLPVFRRGGLRTSREIERERYALKALRGDFASLRSEPRAGGVFGSGIPHAPRGDVT